MKIVAALSGGVDSAVAAARLVDAGHEVVGMHLALHEQPDQVPSRVGACCSPTDAADAARVADALGIDFYLWDLAEAFRRRVVEPFACAYGAGRTPNPCIACNTEIKFGAALERARTLGFDALATGHYARRVPRDGGGIGLLRGSDTTKDQSYVVARLSPAQLARAIFPVGDSLKSEVRAEAGRRGMRVAQKPDSSDICFIPDGDTRAWLRDRLELTEGPIIDAATGVIVGTHGGAACYTIGQRRGLGLGGPDAGGERRYVVDVDVVRNVVSVGPRSATEASVIKVERAVWHCPLPASGALGVQTRAHGMPVPSAIEPGDGDLADGTATSFRARLAVPVAGAAPGQTLAVYAGDEVVCAGVIVG